MGPKEEKTKVQGHMDRPVYHTVQSFNFMLNDLSEKSDMSLTYVIIILDKHDCQPSTVQILETMTSYSEYHIPS